MKKTWVLLAILIVATPAAAQRVIPPTVISPVPPQYSDTARELGIQGTVVLEVTVRTDGRADMIRVQRGLGYGLDENAILAMRRWRFRPGTRDNVPVDVSLNIEVNFNLSDTPGVGALPGDAFPVRQFIPPRVISREDPQYPLEARDQRIMGMVVLEVLIRGDGTPDIQRVVRSIGHGLDASAIDALSRWRFAPALLDGTPIDRTVKIEINFILR
jgi:TonB family protein